MANEQMFKTAFSGFNKVEVTEYLNSINEKRAKDIDNLNSRIAELETALAGQHNTIKAKNNEIEGFLDELNKARKQAAGKLSEMSGLVEELNKNETAMRKDFDIKEADYKAQILSLKKTIEDNRSAFEEEKEKLADKNKSDLERLKAEGEKVREQIERSHREEISKLKGDFDMKIKQLTRQHFEEINSIKDQHKDELIQIENNNKKAIEFAKAEVGEIKASLDSARAIEEDSRVRAAKMEAETRRQCEDMRRRCEGEIAQRREEAMLIVDREINLRRNEVRDAYKKLQEIMDAVDSSRESFVNDCDRIKQYLQGIM